MNNQLQIFNYEDKQVRTVQRDGETWWVLKDVCAVLEIGNNRDVAVRLDDYEKGVDRIDALGGAQEMTVIRESGLYNVIFLSRKPEAKKFRKWVTAEVLPSIRKRGAYLTPEMAREVLARPDVIVEIAAALRDEREKNLALTAKIEENKEKAAFADAVGDAENGILIGALAKLLTQNGVEIGQNRLFERLRRDGFLIKQGQSRNVPTQRAVNMGLLRIKEGVYEAKGKTRLSMTPKVTGKGQAYFLRRYLGETAYA
jgi:anti-repressor protein